MPNTPITMSKLRTIIRLYEDQVGLKTISTMARTSRNTVKKYISKWNTLGLSYDEFSAKSDAELNMLFCIPDDAQPRTLAVMSLMHCFLLSARSWASAA